MRSTCYVLLTIESRGFAPQIYVVKRVWLCGESWRTVTRYCDDVIAEVLCAEGEDFEEARREVLKMLEQWHPELHRRVMEEEEEEEEKWS